MAVDQPTERAELVVIGVHTACEAYPNTLYSLSGLRRDFDVKEINIPLFSSEGGVMHAPSGLLSKAWKIIWAHVQVVAKWMAMHRRPERVLVPYPAPILLCIWSFVPHGLRPRRIVVDAFISLYDTIVNDRGLLRPDDWRAKLLWCIERRAYRIASTVIVDTPLNADFYASLFCLPRNLFVANPLATNELDFKHAPLVVRRDKCSVLFIGTLIPLHGVDVIISAARLLEGRRDIQFTIIGTGQQADILESAINHGAANVTWEREWKTSAQLASYIKQADICLGIFGSGSKGQRVCPYKIYAYASVGRPIVTMRSSWMEQAAKEFGEMPFVMVSAACAHALAAEIVRLADDVALRSEMADRACRFYNIMLDNQKAFAGLRACLMG